MSKNRSDWGKLVEWDERDNDIHWRDLQEKAGVVGVNKKLLKPLTPNQGVYFRAIETSRVTICTGPAGAGKTYIPCGLASQLLKTNRTSKIILTRPLVSCGQGYGHRPGTVLEKVMPMMRPMVDALGDFFKKEEVNHFIEKELVELWPLDDMRGASIRDSFLICDEAQNASYEQLFMLLTRFAAKTRVVVCGDATQSDLKTGENPLLRVMQRLHNIPGISLVRLTSKDIVRDPLVKIIHERLSDEPREDESSYDHTMDAWYSCLCPACKTKVWFNNGNEEDLMVPDVDLIRCWRCSKVIQLPEYEDEEPVLSNEDSGFVEPTFRKPQ